MNESPVVAEAGREVVWRTIEITPGYTMYNDEFAVAPGGSIVSTLTQAQDLLGLERCVALSLFFIDGETSVAVCRMKEILNDNGCITIKEVARRLRKRQLNHTAREERSKIKWT